MLIVTIAALVMAASLGWFAYRLMQEDQRRSEARVALLTAALADDDTPVAFEPPARSTQVGFIAPAAPPRHRRRSPPRCAPMRRPAPGSSTWTTTRVPCARSIGSSRVGPSCRAARPAGIETEPVDVPDELATRVDAPEPPADGGVATRAAGLFADVPEARPADARGLIALAGLVVVGALAVGYVWFGRPAPAASAPARQQRRGPDVCRALAGRHAARTALAVARAAQRRPRRTRPGAQPRVGIRPHGPGGQRDVAGSGRWLPRQWPDAARDRATASRRRRRLCRGTAVAQGGAGATASPSAVWTAVSSRTPTSACGRDVGRAASPRRPSVGRDASLRRPSSI